MVNAATKRISSVVSRNIICVHVGDKYSSDYVEKLYRACIKHNREDFVFTILHDNKSYDLNHSNVRLVEVESMPFVSLHNRWWYKMQAFRKDVADCYQNLLLDLDIVIMNNMDKFWQYNPDNFVIIQDFNRHWFPNYKRSNSSVVKFTPDIANKIYDSFINDPINHVRKFRGDQDWFDEYVTDKVWWPKKWAMSWKWEVYSGGMVTCNSNQYHSIKTLIDPETSMLVFHGKPDPHEVPDDIIKLNWI